MIALLAMYNIQSCKKDLGNYSYHEINNVVIRSLNDTTAIFGKRFVLKPQLVFSQDDGTDTTKYSYEWLFDGPNGLGGRGLYKMTNTKNLDVNMTLTADTYNFFYGVTVKETGVKYQKKFVLKVVNEINEGWFLMCEVNGKARLDMLSKLTDGTFIAIPDLLKTTGSDLVLKGKPHMVYNYNRGISTGPGLNAAYAIYLGTDEATERIDPENFSWKPLYNLKTEIFAPMPADFHADVIVQAGGVHSYMVGGNDAYLYDRTRNVAYSVPINYLPTEPNGFKIAPFAAPPLTSAVNRTQIGIFYDTDNKRFVKHTDIDNYCTAIPDPKENKLFSFSTGMNMIYMCYSPFGAGEIFSVLKDPTSNKRFLASFDGFSNVQSYYAEILATDFDKAEQYAVSPDLGYLFYKIGGKLYQYDRSLKTTKVMLDKGAEKISLIKFQTFLSSKYTDGNKLIVCSYDPAKPEGANGKMEVFTVPSLNADLIPVSSYSGIGKVQSLTYRER